MTMSIGRIFDVAGSALQAQSMRLNTTASNLANAESVAGPDGKVFRPRQVVFAATPLGAPGDESATGVRVLSVVEDASEPRRVHNPGHPFADEAGMVSMPAVNVVEEMVNMISASRAYQNNVEMLATTRSLMEKTLQLGS
jgi:flagellar basal-body rod protein FlgC